MRSFGICLFKYSPTDYEWYVLCVKRSYTYGFLDFLKAGYKMLDKRYITNLVSEMTWKEKLMLIKYNLKHIYTKIGFYKYKEEHGAIFEKLKKEDWFMKAFNSSNNKTLWELPKGRLSKDEHGINAAIREFEEESSIKYSYEIMPNKYKFTIQDRGSYHITYYGARLYDDIKLDLDKISNTEIKQVKWISIKNLTEYNGGRSVKKIADSLFEPLRLLMY